MRILPILFNTEMVRAIQAARKTVTRRVVKFPDGMTGRLPNSNKKDYLYYPGGIKRPPYEPGDVLYVRETWTKLYYVDPDGYTHYDQPMYYYATDGTPDIILCDGDGFEEDDQRIRWRPSIHMPKKAARIFLLVTDVRAERLKNITEEQARAEGFGSRAEFLKAFLAMYPDCTEESWVWAIEFERVDKPEGWPT